MKYFTSFMLLLSMTELIYTQQRKYILTIFQQYNIFFKECSEKLKPYSIISNNHCQTVVESAKEILPLRLCLEQYLQNQVATNQFDKQRGLEKFSQTQEIYSQEIIIDNDYKYLRIKISLFLLENKIIDIDEIFLEIICDFKDSLIISKLDEFTITNQRKIGWIGFSFFGIIKNNYKFLQLKIHSKIVQLSLIKFNKPNQQSIFLDINNIEVWGSKIKDPFSKNCVELDEKQEIINCRISGLIYNHNIKQCVFEKDMCGELNLFENVQQKQCTNACDISEYLYQSSTDRRQYCIQGYNICNSHTMKGCKVCDINSLICFTCKEEYQLRSHACWLNSLDLHSKKQDIQIQGLEKQRILIPTPLCPITCSSCFNQNAFCLACHSPFIFFHGICLLCPRGTFPSQIRCLKIMKVGCAELDSNFKKCIAWFYGFTINIILGTCTRTTLCPANKYASPLGCFNCPVNCSLCYASNICTQCSIGFILLLTTYVSVNPSLLCSTGLLIDGIYSVSNFFVPCTPFCLTCTSAYPNSPICTLCQTGFILVSGVCNNQSTCPTPNCSVCLVSNLCQTCNPGYYLDLTANLCLPCLDMCLSCSSTNSCLSCKNVSLIPPACSTSCPNMYQESVTGICTSCGVLCSSCTNGEICKSCIRGYVLIMGLCFNCPLNCSICSDENRCITCNTGFNLISNVCQICTTPSCQPCLQGFYFDNASQTCLACISFCLTCNNSSSCQICMDTHYLNNSTGYCSPCGSTSCTSICGDGIRSDPMMINGIAIVKQCDDRNSLNNDGCSSTCQIELGYTCLDNLITFSSICQRLPSNTFTMSSSYNPVNGNPIIKIKFAFPILKDPQQVKTGMSIQSLLLMLQKDIFIDILTVPNSAYPFIMTLNLTSDEITLEFIPTQTIKNKVLYLEFKSIYFLQVNNLTPAMKDYPFPDFAIISSAQKEQIKQISLAGTVASQTFLLLIIPTIFFSNIQILFNALDLFQMIFYLQYVDVRLPFNIIEFIKTVADVRIPSPVNIFKYLVDSQPINPPPVPSPFKNGNLKTTFILNIGYSISQLLILGTVHLILKLIVKITQHLKASIFQTGNTYLSTKLVQSWQWTWYLGMYWEMYLSIVVGSILQFYGGEMSNFASILNFSLSVVFFILVVYTPYFVWNIINKQNYKLEQKHTLYKWGMLYEGLNIHNSIQISHSDLDYIPNSLTKNQKQSDSGFQEENHLTNKNNNDTSNSKSNGIFSNRPANEGGNSINKAEIVVPAIQCESRLNANYFDIKQRTLLQRLAKYFYITLYLRKLLFGIIISTLTISPYLQIILICLLNVSLISFIYKIKPYQHSFENLKVIIYEILMIIAQIAIILLASDSDSQSESDRMQIGWVFIMSCSVIMIIQIIYILMDLIPKTIKAIINLVQQFKSKKKVSSEEIEKQQVDKQQSDNSKSVLSYQNQQSNYQNNNSTSLAPNHATKDICQVNDKQSPSKIIEFYLEQNSQTNNYSLIQTAKSQYPCTQMENLD